VKARLRHWLNDRSPQGAQITLSQRCIFVLPSRFALAFLLTLLLILLVGINYQHSLAYALVFLLLSLFFITLLHSFRNLSGLTISAEANPPVFAGGLVSFRVRLLSHKRAHQAIRIGFDKNTLQLLDVPAAGSIRLELEYPADQRGWLKPEPLLIESLFPLGLWRVWSHVRLEQRVLVYPRPLAGDCPLSTGSADSEGEQQAAGIGVDDFQGLRDWQPGHSLARIHWKAFSRGGELLVKEFSALQGAQPWLDFSALQGDHETRLSLLCHQVLKRCDSAEPFGLRLPDQDIPASHGDSHRAICLQALALYGRAP